MATLNPCDSHKRATRRRIWTIYVAISVLACSIANMPIYAARPNILFVFADDWGRFASAYAHADATSQYNDVVRTPHFDQVAARGVLFNNAFVNAPSCTPCRSSLLSGQYFWRTGRAAILQGAVWDSETTAWPLMVRDSGYHIGKSWKVWTPGVPADAPFGQQTHAYETVGRRINAFSQHLEQQVENGARLDEVRAALLDSVRANFDEFLADRTDSIPFCYWFGPTNVHRKWIRGSGEAFWGIDPDDLQGKLPPYLPDVAAVRQDLADYIGEIAAFDAALGVLIETLKARGEYEKHDRYRQRRSRSTGVSARQVQSIRLWHTRAVGHCRTGGRRQPCRGRFGQSSRPSPYDS